MSEAIATWSFEEFVEAEQVSEARHELVLGRVYGMAGGSERHDLAAGFIFAAVMPGAASQGRRPFISNRLLRVTRSIAYYPDVMVAGGAAPDRLFEDSPVLIVEVLSRSTGQFDRREKAMAYASCPSLRLLLLVDPEQRRIEAARPAEGRIDTWTVFTSGHVVDTGFGDIDVDELYDFVDATATT